MTPTPSNDIDLLALDRVLAGNGTPAETSQVADWVACDPARTEWFGAIKDGRVRLVDEEGALARAKQGPETTKPLTERFSGRQIRGIAGWGIAAAIAVAVLGGLYTSARGRAQLSLAAAQDFETRTGQRASIRLNDGTVIHLAPSTQIRVIGRHVTLTGEASFHVSQHGSDAFTVSTGNAMAQVLGTDFSVRKYPADQESRVFVRSGRVGLKASVGHRAAAVLGARDLGWVTDSSVVATPNVDPNHVSDATRGHFSFEDVSLEQVAAELSRAYGTDVRVVDSTLARQLVTIEVRTDVQSLGEVMDFLSRATGAHYRRNAGSLIMMPGRRAAHPRDINWPGRIQKESQYGK